jgi:hypothetical protein
MKAREPLSAFGAVVGKVLGSAGSGNRPAPHFDCTAMTYELMGRSCVTL